MESQGDLLEVDHALLAEALFAAATAGARNLTTPARSIDDFACKYANRPSVLTAPAVQQ